ncbi:MAG TPA: ABC transporter ATP-binding protein [candidate division Zixibacteria bacterium]|nr:ABC transporter ATP-binding protein [candidate division Zixibacteria bacterium]
MKKGSSSREFWQRIVELAAPCWPHLSGILILNLISTPLALLMPLPLKIAVDSVLGTRALPAWLHALVPAGKIHAKGTNLFVAAILLLTIACLSSIQSFASWLLATYTGERLVHDFRSRLLWHVQRLSLAFHDRRGSSDTAYRIQYDAPAIQTIFLQGFVPVVTSSFAFVSMLYITYRISWSLSVIALVLSPVLFVLARNSSRRVRSGYDEVRELDSSAMLVLQEGLASVRAVKAFCQESFQDELFRRKSRMRMREQIRLASIQAGFHVLIGLCIAFGTAIALVIGVTEVRQNTITVGDFLLVMAYMAQLYEPLRTISTRIPELQSSFSSLRRSLALLEETPEQVERRDRCASSQTQPVKGRVEFKSVSFQYPGSSRRVLDAVDFVVPAGSRVGIAGPSGSGKSTLVNLLTRFYDPIEGSISIDGVDLRDFRLDNLRQQFSIVLQEPMLFSTTVAGNIAYARPDASRAEVIEAARRANAHEFIMRLPQAYDTPIGENGARLSGGERQRLAIARAFLKDAPMLILDEPTSSIDVQAEAEILAAVESLLNGRTTFMIAHRLGTLEHCDMVLVLREGRLTLVTRDVAEARTQLMNPEPAGPVLVKRAATPPPDGATTPSTA